MRKSRTCSGPYVNGPEGIGDRRQVSCPLCGRDMIPGPSIDQHHLLPRSHGGKDAVQMHRICHQAIHALLSEQELAARYHTIEALLAHGGIHRFVAWVRKRPVDYMDRSRWSRDRRQAWKKGA